jgi:hypothetical protein
MCAPQVIFYRKLCETPSVYFVTEHLP